MSICLDYHERRGIVSNQDPDSPIDHGRPLHSRVVCDRPACIGAAKGVVKRITGEPGVYYPDPCQRCGATDLPLKKAWRGWVCERCVAT